MDSAACMICGHGGHTVNRCPELVDPLRDGFYRGGGGGGGGGGDDDDEQMLMKIGLHLVYNPPPRTFHSRLRRLRRSVKNPFEDHCATNKGRKLHRIFRIL